MKKVFAAAMAAIAFSASAFAELSFTNKVYSDNDAFFVHDDSSSEDYTFFPDVKEKMDVEYTSDRVDFGVAGIVHIGNTESHPKITGEIDDFYVEFRPIEQITLALHDKICADGSTLAIYDDNLNYADIGSHGFTFVYRPDAFNKGLRVALTVPFEWFLDDVDSDSLALNNWTGAGPFEFGLGFIFTHDLFQFGFTAQNIADNDSRALGVSFAAYNLFGAVEGLNLTVGYGHSEGEAAGADDLIELNPFKAGIVDSDVLNAGITFENDVFNAGAEIVTNFKDAYFAVNVGFGITEVVSFGITGKFITCGANSGDIPTAEEMFVLIEPALEFAVNEQNTIGIGFDVGLCDGSYGLGIPVFWEFKL